MKFPKGLSKKEKMYLKEVYEDMLKKSLKNKTEKKSRARARAKFYEESFKIFCIKEKNLSIKQIWNKNKKRKNRLSYINESVDYKQYKVGDKSLVVSTDKKLLDKYPNTERSGILRDMNDEYEQEILFKAKREYGLSLHPDMYYVIK